MPKRKNSLFSLLKGASNKSRNVSKRRRLTVENLETRRVFASLPFGASEADLGEFLLGSVAVTPVFLESSGAGDTSTEDWTDAHRDEVLANINEGLDWWVDALAAQSTVHQLSFEVDTTYVMNPPEVSYEPISRRSNDYTLYVGEFLTSVGYGSGNLELDVQRFNQAQRELHQTDWSFTMIVVNSQNDSDGRFLPGGSFSRAFAFAGGLFMVVPSTRPASTFAHEMGHIFWGRDEYAGGGSYGDFRGYYNTQNLNASNNPTPGFVQEPSIMASGTLLETAYENHISPASTFAMLGWQDSDNDGIFDVLDVPHRLTGTGYLDVGTSTYRFEGIATVQTLPNLNSSGLQNDITLNRIREIEYRFNGGSWVTALLPDVYVADLDLAINVPSGATEIEIRARDSQTTVVSNIFSGRLSRADSTLVPGINGFVWIDGNQNGLRDAGEYGSEGWTVELVDNAGNVLELETPVEPDSFPDGQLLSGSSPGVTLSAVGSDSDGRIGVFVDSQTSTGTKNFRGYSRAARSYVSNWNTSTRLFQAIFNTPTSVVSLDAIGATSGSKGRLEAYNAAGQLLGRYSTAELASGSAETMTIARGTADIAYVLAGGHANSTVKLDNLTFGPQATTLTQAQGGFAFPSLPVGDYRVRVTPAPGFSVGQPTSGILAARVTANTAAEDIDFQVVSARSDWQNPVFANDVNNDTLVTPLDVLLVINVINQGGARALVGSGLPKSPFIDVNGDQFLSSIDALLVINHLNND